ncbi:MAG: hypothetical protein ACYTF6_10800 [Planctomycetota bacterium]
MRSAAVCEPGGLTGDERLSSASRCLMHEMTVANLRSTSGNLQRAIEGETFEGSLPEKCPICNIGKEKYVAFD